MPRPRKNPVEDIENAPSGVSFAVDRERVLEAIGVSSEGILDSPEKMIDAAQKISMELFLNQAALCLQLQSDRLDGSKMVLQAEDFRVLNILADLMQEFTSYSTHVDMNKAWEIIERAGYTISQS